MIKKVGQSIKACQRKTVSSDKLSLPNHRKGFVECRNDCPTPDIVFGPDPLGSFDSIVKGIKYLKVCFKFLSLIPVKKENRVLYVVDLILTASINVCWSLLSEQLRT